MTPAPDDIPSLESWLRDKALEAHNREQTAITMQMQKHVWFHAGELRAFNEVLAKIQNGRVVQDHSKLSKMR